MKIKPQKYTFVSVWEIQAPIEKIWEEIIHPEKWPTWWTGVQKAKVIYPGNTEGIGLKVALTWHSILPYSLSFESTAISSEYGKEINGIAEGDLNGSGHWQFKEDKGKTIITYTWDVQTTKPWMNFIAPVARPFFVFAHHYIMRKGEKGLQRLLS